MASRVLRLSLIAALLSAAGVHLAVAQACGWAAMAVASLRSAHPAAALARRFDGRHPCRVCLTVKKGGEAPGKREARAPEVKIDLFFAAVSPPLPRPAGTWTPALRAGAPRAASRAIDLPPPRLLRA